MLVICCPLLTLPSPLSVSSLCLFSLSRLSVCLSANSNILNLNWLFNSYQPPTAASLGAHDVHDVGVHYVEMDMLSQDSPPVLSLSPGIRQLGGVAGRCLLPLHVVTAATSTHHPRQSQGLHLLHGAGERDSPLTSALPGSAQVTPSPSQHPPLSSLPSPSTPAMCLQSGQMFQLSVCCDVDINVTFDLKAREKTH